MIERGRPWERPAQGPPAWQVEGDDAALAAAVRDHPGARVGFTPAPSSDLGRALGLTGPVGARLELAVDALRVVADERELFGVNMLVVGTPPDRASWFTAAPPLRVVVEGRAVHDGPATAVVIASGQYLRGNDVVPRGHPGDGRAEIQVYAVGRGERAKVRRRLPQGVHVPHPAITQTRGTVVEVVAERRPVALELDGVAVPGARRVEVRVVPEAFLVVV